MCQPVPADLPLPRAEADLCPPFVWETCVCDKGYVLSAGVCVPKANCGGSYQGATTNQVNAIWEGPAVGASVSVTRTRGWWSAMRLHARTMRSALWWMGSVLVGPQALPHVQPRETLTT
uniref:Uncharacterized protein n=1 Tax=Knipowitschia caucasica TaxID=637954 RepID=A0AAV2MDN5_KNICA